MKKTLVALAAATAMCGASAASLTLYGIVDTGFAYDSVNADNNKALADLDGDSFAMKSGQSSGSRFGFKGEEELGNGVSVGFVLENGFSSDTGADKGAFFDRESSLYLEGGFGKFGVGHLSTFANDAGSTGIGGYFSSFGTGQGDVGCQSYMQAYRPSRMDNSIYYKSPNFAGAEVWVMYSMGDEEKDTVENESSRDRYYAAAVTYNNGGLSLFGAVDVLNKASYSKTDGATDQDDQVTVTAAVNYDCGFAKSYLGAHWFDNAKSVGGDVEDDWGRLGGANADGWSVMAGVDVPVGNGKIKTSIGYLDASSDDDTQDLKRYMAAAAYEYYLSKRTTFYAGAGYIQDDDEVTDPSWVQVNAGLKIKF